MITGNPRGSVAMVIFAMSKPGTTKSARAMHSDD
jgi:hypothetical protein